jgi:hypothetical protein
VKEVSGGKNNLLASSEIEIAFHLLYTAPGSKETFGPFYLKRATKTPD